MYTQIQKTIPAYYKNRGQQAERVFRYTNTGLLCKADNTPCTVSGDCGDVQVKSARATVCKGLDIESYIDTDKANSYAYITADYSIAYIMNPIEWITFVKAFSTIKMVVV